MAFPKPAPAAAYSGEVEAFVFGGAGGRRVAILPDIYGCNDFYRGLATYLAAKGAEVFLVDPFAGLGDLSEQTREAAFERRSKLADAEFVNRFERFAAAEFIDGVVGFCLGGLFVFELARRGLEADLVGLYGFPQGLPNKDPLPTPFDYLQDVRKPFIMLLGADDEAVGPDNVARLLEMEPKCGAMGLKVYDGVGHNFLPFLDSDDEAKQAIASDALDRIGQLV